MCLLSQSRVISPLNSNWNEIVPRITLETRVSVSDRICEINVTYIMICLGTVVYESTEHPAKFRETVVACSEVSLDETKSIGRILANFGIGLPA